MKNRTKSEVSNKTASHRRGNVRPKPRFHSSSEKLGFFRWRTSLHTLQSSKHVPRVESGHDSALVAGNDAALQERAVVAQRLIESIPNTTEFLRLSSVDPFTPFPGPEDPYLVQEVLDHARNSFWLDLFVTRRPTETPHPSLQGKSKSSEA